MGSAATLPEIEMTYQDLQGIEKPENISHVEAFRRLVSDFGYQNINRHLNELRTVQDDIN